MTLATAALCRPKSVTSVAGRGVHRGDVAALGQRHPLEQARVQLGPGGLEQPLLGERVLGVEHDQLGARLLRLEIVRDQARALVGPGRAAERIRRRCDHDEPAVRHGLELPAQQQGLLARAPGMRHMRGRRLVVAGQRAPADVDAGRQHEPVVRQARAVGERDRPRLARRRRWRSCGRSRCRRRRRGRR